MADSRMRNKNTLYKPLFMVESPKSPRTIRNWEIETRW